MTVTESTVEDAALAWFGELGYAVLHGPDIAPGEPVAERDDYGEAVLPERLRRAMRKLNPDIPEEAIDEAYRKVVRVGVTHASPQHNRRPDVVIFVNGLPLAVIELKNPADENATIWTAFNQLQTYKQQIPGLFVFNEALIISDGLEARIGTLTADRERFMP